MVVGAAGTLKPAMLRALGAYMGYEYHDDGSFTETPGGRQGSAVRPVRRVRAQQADGEFRAGTVAGKLGVKLGDNRVLSPRTTAVNVETNPNSDNPVAKA